jgi:capsular exopolysaccharide synthesis family protein
MEYSIKEIVSLLMKRMVFIVTCTLVGLCVFFLISQYVIKPSYTASVQMYVSQGDSTTSANLNELNYAQKVVSTYINFLQTKVFYDLVLENSELEYTREDLKEMTRIQTVNNTEIFQISVTTHNPNDSFELVNSMQQIAPGHISSIKDNAKISVVDPVIIPTVPSSPNVLLNTFVGGMAGLVISVLLSFLWETIDVNVKNQEDLTKKYHLPILGAIPNFNSNHLNPTSKWKFINNFKRKEQQENSDNNINDDSKFMINESYKALRTNLRFTLRSDSCKKILISSPVPEDGKSTTSTNVAITIAQTGVKVLLVDCDLRKGRLHSSFKLKNSPGISDTLSGLNELKEVIQYTSYANLHVITMGSIPPNPTELLASSQMEEFLQKVEKEYDYIIIDTPPVNVVSDSLSLVKLVDGVLLVVRENNTSHPNIQGALQKYEFVEANLLGFVLNGVSLNQGKSKKQYYYYNYSDKNG